MNDITNMNYSEFVGLVDERNRPSGGIKSVHTAIVNARLDSSKRVLEIGSNTGFTSVNLSLFTGCEVVGIETNASSIKKAEQYAANHGTENRVSFLIADACNLPFDDSSFDMIWCSNVTSFISDKEKAVSEYIRVLKTGGILVLIPIYYIENPPKEILRKVSDAIGVEVKVQGKQSWIDLIVQTAEATGSAVELFFDEDYRYLDMKGNTAGYIDCLMHKDEVLQFEKTEQDLIREKAKYFYELFNENLQYAGYSILLLQKRKMKDEVELFLSEKI